MILSIFAQRSSGHHAQGCRRREDRLPLLAKRRACSPRNDLINICDNESLREQREIGKLRSFSISIHTMNPKHFAVAVVCRELMPVLPCIA